MHATHAPRVVLFATFPRMRDRSCESTCMMKARYALSITSAYRIAEGCFSEWYWHCSDEIQYHLDSVIDTYDWICNDGRDGESIAPTPHGSLWLS